MFTVSQIVTTEYRRTFTREEAIALLSKHDPQADFSFIDNQDLAHMFVATLNDYPDSELHGEAVDSAYVADHLDTTDWRLSE